jgi:hypothetical protein
LQSKKLQLKTLGAKEKVAMQMEEIGVSTHQMFHAGGSMSGQRGYYGAMVDGDG